MPTYQYACTDADCGNEFDLVQSFTDPAASECPVCGKPVRKVFSAVGVVFKGSGFYRTDSRAAANKAADSASSGSKDTSAAFSGGKDSSSSGSSGSSDSSTSSSGSSGSSSGSSASPSSTPSSNGSSGKSAASA